MPKKKSQSDKFPKKLGRDTITEAIFEIRFQGTQKLISDILAGILFQKLTDKYPTISKLVFSSIPQELIDSDPNLKYKASTKLHSDTCALMVGNNVLTVSNLSPYEGWGKFNKRIHSALNILHDSKLIDKVERVAVRYTNIVPKEDGPFGKDHIKFSGNLGSYDLANENCYIRSEINIDDCINIIQVRSHSYRTDNNKTGIFLDIDTIYNTDKCNFWDSRIELVDKIHNVEKSIFFNILTKETINKLKPEW